MDDQFSTGSVQTIEDLVRQILAALLGQAAPAGGTAMSKLLMPLIRKLTGNDLAWDVPVVANTTAEGVYSHQIKRRVSNMQEELAKEVQQTVTENLVRDWERTKNSYADWQLKHPKGTRGEYDLYIETKTRHDMESGIYKAAAGWLNNTFDLNGGAGVGESIGRAAANFAKAGYRRNDPYALQYGRQMVEDLFLTPEMRTVHVGNNEATVPVRDANGNIKMKSEFDRSDWSGMNQKAVADIASVLSSEVDMLRGIDPSKPAELKRAADRFKDMVHEYATALAPLRDVFGDDVGSMINALQQTTGASVTQLGGMRASSIATQLAARYNAGMYTTQFMTNNTRVMEGLVDQMPSLNAAHYMNIANMAIRGSDMARGSGAGPSWMRQEQWDKEAQQLAFQTSVSEGANAIALDYSIWAKEQEKARKDTSWEAFERAMAPALRRGVDARVAAGELSGALTYAEKREGLAYNYYNSAVVDGRAADMALREALKERREAAIQLGMSGVEYKNIIERVGSRNGQAPAHDWRWYSEQMTDILEHRADFHNMSSQQDIRKALLEIQTVRNGELVQAYTKDDAEILSGMMHLAFNERKDSIVMDWLKAAKANSGREDAMLYETASRERREKYKNLEADLMKPGSQLIGDLLHNGLSIEAIRQRLAEGEYIGRNEHGQYADTDKLSVILAAGKAIAEDKYDNKDEAVRDKARAGYVSRFYKYANSERGLRSQTFQANLKRYEDELAKGDKADKKVLRDIKLRLDAEMNFGEETVKKLDRETLYTAKGKKIKGDNFETVQGMTSDELALEHVNSAIYSLSTEDTKTIEDKLAKAKDERTAARKEMEKLEKEYNEDPSEKRQKALSKANAAYAEKDKAVEALEKQLQSLAGTSGESNKLAQEIWKEMREDMEEDDKVQEIWTKRRDELKKDYKGDLDKAAERLKKAKASKPGKWGFGGTEEEIQQELTEAQAAYDEAERVYKERMSAVETIDRELGTAKKDMESAPQADDKLDLVTVLNKLNDTLNKINTDNHNLTGSGKGNTAGGTSTQDSVRD